MKVVSCIFGDNACSTVVLNADYTFVSFRSLKKKMPRPWPDPKCSEFIFWGGNWSLIVIKLPQVILALQIGYCQHVQWFRKQVGELDRFSSDQDSANQSSKAKSSQLLISVSTVFLFCFVLFCFVLFLTQPYIQYFLCLLSPYEGRVDQL